MAADGPKVTHVTADSVTIDGEVMTTVVAVLDDGRMYYTGATDGAEWHPFPPFPDSTESD